VTVIKGWQTTSMSDASEIERGNPRAEAMAVFARLSTSDFSHALAAHFPNVHYSNLKPAATGLVMLRGRIGGDGAPFNVGEATVSKAVIELENGIRGYGHCLGRDNRKAELAAVFDALWQQDPHRIEELVLGPARINKDDARQTRAAQTAATKVDFFTLVRGED
jgi:alpha-D-ribose 1-methylphosphonate 5-triphosphate synthase subunit PhnG